MVKGKGKAKQQSAISKSVAQVANSKNKKIVGKALANSKKVKGTSNLGAWNSKNY